MYICKGTRRWTHYYGCDTKLESSKVTRVVVEPWSNENAVKGILEEILRRKNRTLTTNQWRLVREQVKVEPTALYVQLALRVVGSWTSYESSTDLLGGVRN